MISHGYAVLSFLAAFLAFTPAGAGTLVNTQFIPFSVNLETENAKCAAPDKALGKLVLPAKYTKTKVTFFLLCFAKGKEGDRVLFLGTEERNDGLAIGAWLDSFARGRKDGLPIDFSYSVSDPGLYGQVYAGLPLRSVKVLSGDTVRLPFEQIALPNSAGKADVYYAPLLINKTSTFRGVHRHHGLAVLRSPQGKIIWIIATNSKFSEFRRVPAGTNKPVNQILRAVVAAFDFTPDTTSR